MTVYELFTLCGGIGLFLYGMSIMSTGLRNACGERLKTLLEAATRNKLMAVLSGLLVTIFIQSSSATDVMVIGFVTSGLMTLSQAIGVIMGANIGTTVTAQITAFNIGAYAPMILFIGAIMFLFLKNNTLRYSGQVILGFGMLFQGITLMKSAIIPLSETPAFINFVSTLSNPILTVIFGVLFTALLQSSSSATVIIQAFVLEGLIGYKTAVYLIIGAAVGSVTPNLLAGLTANRAGKRCSVLNLLFNLFRAVLILTLITVFPQILTMIQNLSPGNPARQIANTHTLFAIIAVAILLPFTEYIVKLSKKLIPADRSEQQRAENRRLVYLTQTDLPPAMSIDLAHREIVRMGELATRNLSIALENFFQHDNEKKQTVDDLEDAVDYLSDEIVRKLTAMHATTMRDSELNQIYRMIRCVDDLERISDHAVNITRYEELIHSGKGSLSDDAIKDLKTLSEVTQQSLKFCLTVYKTKRIEDSREAEMLESMVDRQKEIVVQNHIKRLALKTCNPQGGIILTDMAVDLERCSDHAINLVQSLQQ